MSGGPSGTGSIGIQALKTVEVTCNTESMLILLWNALDPKEKSGPHPVILSTNSKFRGFIWFGIYFSICLQISWPSCRLSGRFMLLQTGMVVVLICYLKRQCIISIEFLTRQLLYKYTLFTSSLFLDELIS